jgi:rubrerythrin
VADEEEASNGRKQEMMSALDELIKNAKTANEGLKPHYMWQNNGTGINLAYNMTTSSVTEPAEAELAALRARVVELEKLFNDIEWDGDRYKYVCPVCGNYKEDGHDVSCRLSAALK